MRVSGLQAEEDLNEPVIPMDPEADHRGGAPLTTPSVTLDSCSFVDFLMAIKLCTTLPFL